LISPIGSLMLEKRAVIWFLISWDGKPEPKGAPAARARRREASGHRALTRRLPRGAACRRCGGASRPAKHGWWEGLRVDKLALLGPVADDGVQYWVSGFVIIMRFTNHRPGKQMEEGKVLGGSDFISKPGENVPCKLRSHLSSLGKANLAQRYLIAIGSCHHLSFPACYQDLHDRHPHLYQFRPHVIISASDLAISTGHYSTQRCGQSRPKPLSHTGLTE
jgi:hypothetical protein